MAGGAGTETENEPGTEPGTETGTETVSPILSQLFLRPTGFNRQKETKKGHREQGIQAPLWIPCSRGSPETPSDPTRSLVVPLANDASGLQNSAAISGTYLRLG